MTGRTRYGDLLRDAAAQIAAASLALQRERFPDRPAAKASIGAYRDLLHALSRHGRQLLGSDVRITGIRSSRNADPREVDAVRLIDELATVGRVCSDRWQPPSAAAAGWTAATESIRVASDLLATHREVDGAWRTPHAQLLDDPAVRAVGCAELAALVVPTAEAAARLGLRAGQSGIGWRDVDRLVPQTQTLLDVALDVRGRATSRGGEPPLRAMVVARPAVRTGDPIVELGDRLARLHRMAWQLTREPHVGIGTLGDFAAAGVFVHEHALRLLHRAREAQPQAVAGLAGRLQQAGTAWREVHLHSRQLRTATPPLLAVRGDVLAIRQLLDQVGPQAQSVLFGATRAFADVARWNAAVVEHLHCTGQLYVPGRLLSGDEVTDHPGLVEAKLADRLTIASRDHIDPLSNAYEVAQDPASTSASRVAHAPLELPAYTEPPSSQGGSESMSP